MRPAFRKAALKITLLFSVISLTHPNRLVWVIGPPGILILWHMTIYCCWILCRAQKPNVNCVAKIMFPVIYYLHTCKDLLNLGC